jgi:putative cell wall binding repeat protein
VLCLSPRRGAFLVLCVVALAGCGGGSKNDKAGTPDTRPVLGQKGDEAAAAQGLGFPGFATKNTTRVGGGDPVADAAGVAEAVFPARSPDTRPAAVVLADRRDWRVAASAAQLSSPPLRAPVLLTDGASVPEATGAAIDRLDPTGSKALDGAQAIKVGAAGAPAGLKTTDVAGGDYATLAAAIDKLATKAAGEPSKAVVIASADAPDYSMPAAAWAAKSGNPLLWVGRDAIPAATRKAIQAHNRPDIYVLGPPQSVSDTVLEQLDDLGTARRVSGKDPVANAIAFARFSDGSFGWNVVDPGHGLVFASVKRPLDAAAGSMLSTSGTYGPLLLLPDATTMPPALQGYLLDIQPGYEKDPVRGVYNHGWIMGDETAISVDVQARIDTLLEIQPVNRQEP